jgi:2-keto-3-deoxygluconate permease
MKILKTVNRVPGGLMVVPLFLGMVLNTFFPDLLRIGGFTQALTGVGYPTVLGMYLFTVGTKMTFRAAPRMLLRGGGILAAKVGTATLFALTVANSVGGSVLGLSTLAVMVAMSDTNGGMFLALTSVMGNKEDSGTYVVQSVETGPFLTMLIFVGAGLAVIPWLTMLWLSPPSRRRTRQPDDDIRSSFGRTSQSSSCSCVYARPDDQSRSVVTAGPGIMLGITVVVVTGWSASSRTNCSAAPLRRRGLEPPAIPRPCRTRRSRTSPTAGRAGRHQQVAASVIVTAILTPLLTSWWYKRVMRERDAKAAEGVREVPMQEPASTT